MKVRYSGFVAIGKELNDSKGHGGAKSSWFSLKNHENTGSLIGRSRRIFISLPDLWSLCTVCLLTIHFDCT